jgi:hypothetical protein
MSLGIFSFDLAALLKSVLNFNESSEPEPAFSKLGTTLEKIEDVLPSATRSDPIIDDVLTAAAINKMVTSVISADNAGKEKPAPLSSAAKPPAGTDSKARAEVTRQEIERLIKSLQTSVVHNYRSSDIIDQNVSLNDVMNFPRRDWREDDDEKRETEQRKNEAHKSELLRAELKKAMLWNNSGV